MFWTQKQTLNSKRGDELKNGVTLTHINYNRLEIDFFENGILMNTVKIDCLLTKYKLVLQIAKVAEEMCDNLQLPNKHQNKMEQKIIDMIEEVY